MSDFILFKYRAINKCLLDSLVKGSIYFARPASLNDPFDCQVDVKKSALHAISQLSGTKKEILRKISKAKGYFSVIQDRMKKVGVCSFSLSLEEPLLWSHYADEHRGVCLTYKFTEEFILEKTNEIVGASPVEYDIDPLTNWFIENTPSKYNENFESDFTVELLKKVLIVKGRGWGYEGEFRIIREKDGSLSIPKKCLTQVCFGLNTTAKDIDLVKKLIMISGYTVNFCQIVRKENDFGIKAIEI